MATTKTKLMIDAEKAISDMDLSKKEREAIRQENLKKIESKMDLSKKEMESIRQENLKKIESKMDLSKKEMEDAREETSKKYGYKTGGLVKQGKPKIAKKGWR